MTIVVVAIRPDVRHRKVGEPTGERMDHEELRDLTPLYAVGALPDEERREVEEHLRSCASCCWEALGYVRALANAVRDRRFGSDY